MTEIRTISTTGAEKGVKLARFDLIPNEALRTVAIHYGKGTEKYSGHNWRLGYEWSKSYAALQRHANSFWGGEDIDPETQSPHMAAVVFHALALLEFMDNHRKFDDRWSTTKAKNNQREMDLRLLREKLTGNPEPTFPPEDLL